MPLPLYMTQRAHTGAKWDITSLWRLVHEKVRSVVSQQAILWVLILLADG